MLTVRFEIENQLHYGCSMREEDVAVFMEQVVQEMNQDKDDGLMRKDGQLVPIAECWDTDHNDYPMEVTDALQNRVEMKALEWCIKRLNAQTDVLQEIQRLSSTALNEQGKAEK